MGRPLLGEADAWAAEPRQHHERMAVCLAIDDLDERVRHLFTVPYGYPNRETAVALLLPCRPGFVVVATDQERSRDDARRPADTVLLASQFHPAARLEEPAS